MAGDYPRFKSSYTHEELVEHFLLSPAEHALIATCRGDVNRHGVAVLLKAVQYLGYFPDDLQQVPETVRTFMAHQLQLLWDHTADYPRHPSTRDVHVALIRQHTGLHFPTGRDKQELETWLRTHEALEAPTEEDLCERAYARLRACGLELPAESELQRIVRAALHGFFHDLYTRVTARRSATVRATLDQLLVRGPDEAQSAFDRLKTEPSAPGVQHLQQEVTILQTLRAVEVPPEGEHSLFFKVQHRPYMLGVREQFRLNTLGIGGPDDGFCSNPFARSVSRAQRRTAVRQRLHDRFDVWLNQLEARMEDRTPTLEELTQAVLALRQELTQAVTEGLVEQAHRAALEQRTAVCPQCGQTLSARGPQERTVETLVGAIRLRRPYFYCERCRLGNAPLDAALGLTERRKQPDVQKAAVQLTKEVPYETACELFAELTGLPLSAHTAHEVTQAVAEGLTVLDVAPSCEEVLTKITAVATGQPWRPILVLAIDGADVPTRPETAKGRRPGRKRVRVKRGRWTGEWREAKGFRFYLLVDDRIVQVLSWHQVQTDEEAMEALRQVKAAGLIPEEEVRLCVIADGARWIWKQARALFPSAVEILDYYHCSERLHKVAALQYRAHPERQRDWCEAALARLFYGEVHGVIWGLQRMKPTDAQAAEEIAKLIPYLQRHQERLDYRFARKGGYPMGSGGIESANKFICHVRLKRSGAWWYVTNANQMLALRCAKYNGTFDRVFARYRQRIQDQSG